jgi:hypothetical protein
MTKATGEFQVLSGNEEPIEELEGGGRLTRAWGVQKFSGDLKGDGAIQWLMSYGPDKTAHLVGLQRITGSIGDRSGSFLIDAVADHDGKASIGTWSVVAGSGTKGLKGLTGSGSFKAGPGPGATYELDYALE